MSSNEANTQSMEIEMFLVKVLNIKNGSRSHEILEGFYQSLVFYEDGHTYIPPSQHKARMKRLLKYFEKAIDKLSKKDPRVNQLKTRITLIDSTVGILDLYRELKALSE